MKPVVEIAQSGREMMQSQAGTKKVAGKSKIEKGGKSWNYKEGRS